MQTGGQGHQAGFGSSEEGVLAPPKGRRWDPVSGTPARLPGFPLTLPDPGCAHYLTLFVSQGHYLKSGDNDGT